MLVLHSRQLAVITFRSGRELRVPATHKVFAPLGDYREGDVVDPASVDVAILPVCELSETRTGSRIIIDGLVEVVERVATRVDTGGRE